MSTDLLDEKAIRNAITGKKGARLRDIFGPSVAWWSNPPSAWGSSGRPDIELCATIDGKPGTYVGLELKAQRFYPYAHDGLSDEQAQQLLRIAKAGGVALVCAATPEQLPKIGWALQCERMTIACAFEPCLITKAEYGARIVTPLTFN